MKTFLILAIVAIILATCSVVAALGSAHSLLAEKRDQLIKVKSSMMDLDVLKKAAKSVGTSDLSALINEYSETYASLQSVATRLDTEISALSSYMCSTMSNCSALSVTGVKSVGNMIKTSGSSNALLQEDEVMISSNGRYTLKILKEKGHLVIVDLAHNIGTFTIPTQSTKMYLSLQANGDLVLRNSADDKALWHTDKYSKAAPYTLILENNGELVVYDKNNVMVWTSATENGSSYTWGSPSIKQVNDLLISKNGRFMFKIQENGAAVLTDRSTGKNIYSTGTTGAGNSFCLQTDGNLVVYSKEVVGLWHIASEWKGKRLGPYRLVLTDEGALIFYDKNDTIVWQRGN